MFIPCCSVSLVIGEQVGLLSAVNRKFNSLLKMEEDRVDLELSCDLYLGGLEVLSLEFQRRRNQEYGGNWISSAIVGGPGASAEREIKG